MRKLLSVCLLALGLISGCGGGAPPAITITFGPGAPQAIDQGQSVNFTVTVANDASNRGVTWTVSGTACTGAACGTLTNVAITSVTYNAPASVSSNLVVTITATSVTDPTKSASVTLTVTPLPAISTTSLPNGTVGTAYSATLQVSGGVQPFTWSLTAGTLPAGLSLNGTTGVISGTPTTAGTSNFTVQVRDSGSPPQTATKALSIVINPAPLTITTASLPNGTVNAAYNQTLQSSGGTPPVTWSLAAGTLPGGLEHFHK